MSESGWKHYNFMKDNPNNTYDKDALNWSKVTVKTFIMLQKILFQINAVLLNFLFIKESWEIKCVTDSTKKLFSTLIIIINVSWASNHHIRVISEGSCDTEDWSNDAENSALITGIYYALLYIHIENSYFKLQ